jgi:hypothetical protein
MLELRTVGPIAMLTVALAACSSSSAGTTAPTTGATQTMPVSSPSAKPSPVPTVAPSPTLAVLPKGLVVPGTYVSRIQPGLTLTLDQTAENDSDIPTSWIDLVFEGDSQFEIHIIRLDNVFDPKHAGKLIDLPPNLTAWLVKLPGITVVHPAKTVQVGGLDATQLDLRTGPKGIMIAPIPGVDLTSLGFGDVPYLGWRESGDLVRLIVVPVGGHQVVISMLAIEDPRGVHFDATVKALQPVVDSIVWH